MNTFQEKHTTGHMWWKKTYYKYYQYDGNALKPVIYYPLETIKALEAGK